MSSYTLLDPDGQQVVARPDQLAQALQQGFELPEGRYRVSGGGKTFEVDAKDAAMAVTKHRMELEDDQGRQARWKQQEYGDATGKLAALAQGLDPLGGATIAGGVKLIGALYGDQAEENFGRYFAEAREANPGTYTAGIVGGLAANIAGGVVAGGAKAAGAGAAKLGLGKTAALAYSAPARAMWAAGEKTAKALGVTNAVAKTGIAAGVAGGMEGVGMYLREEALGNIEHSAENFMGIVGFSAVASGIGGAGLTAGAKGAGILYEGTRNKIAQLSMKELPTGEKIAANLAGQASGRLPMSRLPQTLGQDIPRVKKPGTIDQLQAIFSASDPQDIATLNKMRGFAFDEAGEAVKRLPKVKVEIARNLDELDATVNQLRANWSGSQKRQLILENISDDLPSAVNNQTRINNMLRDTKQALAQYQNYEPSGVPFRQQLSELFEQMTLSQNKAIRGLRKLSGKSTGGIEGDAAMAKQINTVLYDQADEIKSLIYIAAADLQQAGAKPDLYRTLYKLSKTIQDDLTNPDWGNIAHKQAVYNKSWKALIDAEKQVSNLRQPSTTTVGTPGKPGRFHPDKLGTNIQGVSKGNKALETEFTLKYLRAVDNHVRTANKLGSVGDDVVRATQAKIRGTLSQYQRTVDGLRFNAMIEGTKSGGARGLQWIGQHATKSTVAAALAGGALTAGALAGALPAAAGIAAFTGLTALANPAISMRALNAIPKAKNALGQSFFWSLGKAAKGVQTNFGRLGKTNYIVTPKILQDIKLRDDTSGKEKPLWEHLRENIQDMQELVRDPERVGANVKAALGPELFANMPKITEHLSFMAMHDMQYLLSIAPKDPLPVDPFAKKAREWRPSTAAMSNFAAVSAMLDDFRVFVAGARYGGLTPAMIEAARQRRPELLANFVDTIMAALEDGEDIPAELRKSLRQIVGVPAAAPGTLTAIQQIYQPNAGQGQNAPQVASARGSGAKTKLNPGNWAPQSQTGVLGPRA